MKVFKFGGASVNSAERIKNVGKIIAENNSEGLLIIISAMGKTTNALEKVADAFFAGNKDEALALFSEIKDQHISLAKTLLPKTYHATYEKLVNFFTEVEWLLHDNPVREYDYYYDQLVCVGELLSTCIVSAYLNEEGITNKWLDVRDLLRTDDNFRDAIVDWEITAKNIAENRIGQNNEIIITQGFIGATDENESTTLGREGSDFSAAIFANLLNAESLTIWKDVVGVMSADPKEFQTAELIDELSYTEVIEMAYYGAQVIHPKTIKPLQNKQIPLLVKSFIDTSLPGTIISKKITRQLPPIIVVKPNQVVMQLKTQDFSFISGKPLEQLYEKLTEIKIRPNIIQTGAINALISLDDRSEKIEQLAIAAGEIFEVMLDRGLTLLTIRYFNEEILNEMTAGKDILVMQKTKQTVQVLYK